MAVRNNIQVSDWLDLVKVMVIKTFRGLSDGVLHWSECREDLLSCLIFFLFVWTLSLCAVCHTATLKIRRGMFSPSSSYSGCSFPHISHSSSWFISHLHFILFETHQYEMDPCFLSNNVKHARVWTTVSLWVWPQHWKSKSKTAVKGVYCKVKTKKVHFCQRSGFLSKQRECFV